jgi:hypothetical protein
LISQFKQTSSKVGAVHCMIFLQCRSERRCLEMCLKLSPPQPQNQYAKTLLPKLFMPKLFSVDWFPEMFLWGQPPRELAPSEAEGSGRAKLDGFFASAGDAARPNERKSRKSSA